MPAAAVIPAPLTYIKAVAVKKLVVGFLSFFDRSVLRMCIWLKAASSLRLFVD